MSHERMLRAEKELEKEINALIRKAEILEAQLLSAGLQLPGGGGQRPPGDRGGGRQQPTAGYRAPGAVARGFCEAVAGADRRQRRCPSRCEAASQQVM